VRHPIIDVLKGSVCEELGIKAGDVLIAINNQPIEDMLDYQYYDAQEKLTLTIQDKKNEVTLYEVEKYDYEHLGLCFENDLLTTRHCANKCIFCFVDQLPPNLRKTLYVKDDDWRLSVLMGNYVTLTNMRDKEIERIIDRQISPLYISVHTTNPELRKYMLSNPKAGELMPLLKRLAAGGIKFHTQVVLCPDVNDGFHLRQTFEDLFVLHPNCLSLAVVPVGLTYHRKGLTKLKKVDTAMAQHVIEDIHKWQDKCLEMKGTRFIFAADELYLTAGKPLPDYDSYEGFPQIENGVGLLVKFERELTDELPSMPPWIPDRKVSMACGTSAEPFFRKMCAKLNELYPNLKVNIYPIKNYFFGESITVSGLLTGKDIGVQTDGRDLGSELFISKCMLRAGTDIFLDDVTVSGLSGWINKKVTPIDNDGAAFARYITGTEEPITK